MKARGRLAVLACAAAMLLALPAGAAAKPDPEVHPGTFDLEVRLPERDGYLINLTASDHRQIHLTVERGSASVRYRVAGRASSRRVKANFGPLGRVDIRMDLEPRPLSLIERLLKVRGERCRGKKPTKLAGQFQGTVEFQGETDVVGVSARRGHALVERTFRTVCKPRVSKPSKGKEKAQPDIQVEASLLAASAHTGGRTTSFRAIDLGIDSELFFGLVSGAVHERLGRVRIMRSAFELTEGSALKFAPARRNTVSAKVKPPEPFTGSATYSKATGSPAAWTGDLAVRLPGTGNVPLSGPEFDAMLCRADGIEALAKLGKFVQCLLETKTLSFPSSLAELLRGRSDAWRVMGVMAPASRHSLALALGG
jgi:hypothetical protein